MENKNVSNVIANVKATVTDKKFAIGVGTGSALTLLAVFLVNSARNKKASSSK